MVKVKCESGKIYVPDLGCKPKNKIRRINNITIFYDDLYKFGCKSPDGRIMEDRMTYKQAIKWAKETFDWTSKRNNELY